MKQRYLLKLKRTEYLTKYILAENYTEAREKAISYAEELPTLYFDDCEKREYEVELNQNEEQILATCWHR